MRTSTRITLLAAEESSLTFLEEVLPELSDFSSGETPVAKYWPWQLNAFFGQFINSVESLIWNVDLTESS